MLELGFDPGRRQQDGIELSRSRGEIARNWWSREWLYLLEHASTSSPRKRGRKLARLSRVQFLVIAPGVIRGRVAEGGEGTFDAAICSPPLSPAQWRRVNAVLTADTALTARLLAGTMPEAVKEHAFDTAELLFGNPTRGARCTCGRDALICRHAFALACVAADVMDRDPFYFLGWRGQTRRQFVNALRAGWDLPPVEDVTRTETPARETLDVNEFFRSSAPLPTDSTGLALPPFDVLALLGPPPVGPPGDGRRLARQFAELLGAPSAAADTSTEAPA